ncbi:helix-turn-helix transcriptional regulator [Kineococcus terrestris]|uniref:helix-turn-helix transcriptional regulator n=1 Tax=Kineococcus terrestris TaxID=2044856 RepID=UPI0034DB46BD
MRADRLVSLVLLLRQRGRMTAGALAAELEVSERTVLRDVEALSTAGVPVYAERGRHGGFSLLPGFRTELAGLNHEEALALLTAGVRRGGDVLGLGAALASAVRKVVDALPQGHRGHLDGAAQRFLVEPATDLLSRPAVTEDLAEEVVGEVRRAVLAGRRLRLEYATAGAAPTSRTVDPLGLVVVRGRTYLLATRDGEDRTYRLSRVVAAQGLAEPAQRPAHLDLDRVWAERSARFLSEGHVAAVVRVRRARREELLDTARAVRAEEPEADGWVRMDLSFEDLRHALWAVWRLGTDAEAVAPDALRAAVRDRAASLLDRYRS